MAKSDFEFYTLQGVGGEFVVPAPACDPYHRSYDVTEIPTLAIDSVASVVRRYAGDAEITTELAAPEDVNCTFFRTLAQGHEVIPQRTEITVHLDEEDGYYSSAMTNVLSELANGPGEVALPRQRDPVGGRTPRTPLAYREQSGITGDVDILDFNNKPINPELNLRQLVHLAGYRWLPGPERKSSSGLSLPPNYCPRPARLAVAQLITITGINPLAESK